MAASKEELMKTANETVKTVQSIRDGCETAYRNIREVLDEVRNNWQSTGGNALSNALLDLSEVFQKAYTELDEAVKTMKIEAKAAYNNWPTEE